MNLRFYFFYNHFIKSKKITSTKMLTEDDIHYLKLNGFQKEKWYRVAILEFKRTIKQIILKFSQITGLNIYKIIYGKDSYTAV